MGANIARQAIAKGHQVVGTSLHGVAEELLRAGVEPAGSLEDVARRLRPPRLIFVYVPHGAPTDEVVAGLSPLLGPGDVLADAGNSHWRDAQRRHAELKRRGIGFLDIGTSGGIRGAREGACFMVGGDLDAFGLAERVLADLAVAGGLAHVGPAGAGHYAKLVHNAIEFGMLQAIGEGVDLLVKSDYEYDLPQLFHNWSHGSVIRGWLVELMERGLREHPDLAQLSPYVEDTREVRWVVEHALEREVWIPVIAQAELALYRYRDPDSTAAKAVALMRHGFGGHPLHRVNRDPIAGPERREPAL